MACVCFLHMTARVQLHRGVKVSECMVSKDMQDALSRLLARWKPSYEKERCHLRGEWRSVQRARGGLQRSTGLRTRTGRGRIRFWPAHSSGESAYENRLWRTGAGPGADFSVGPSHACYSEHRS